MNVLPKDAFFERTGDVALTYDDVRLKVGYAEVMPDDVHLESCFARNVALRVPIVSSPMDTVTEYALAIELAKLGGLGIIHRNLIPKEQASQVARVKYHLNGMIARPICFHEQETIGSILATREEKGYTFHSFPIVNDAGTLVGVITGNDFDFCANVSLPVSQVMTREVITAPEGTTVDKAYALMREHRRKILPIATAAGGVAGLYTFSDVKRIVSGRSVINNLDDRGQLRVGAAIGTGPEALERLALLVEENVDVVVIDSAHADSAPVITALTSIKKTYPDLPVVVGNVSEADSTRRLIKAGADGIKVGQGPGSICTTRVVAGIGCPQVTAVYNCAKAARGSDVPVCADGGIQYSGDIPVAIGAGAHSVMLGGLLAGTKEAPGETVLLNGRQWKMYRGMGSLPAMLERAGSRERYQQSGNAKSPLVPEGIEGYVPFTGELKDVFLQLIGGLRRGMGYVGAASIEELGTKADFWRLSPAGQRESHPHHVVITKEAPNYRKEG